MKTASESLYIHAVPFLDAAPDRIEAAVTGTTLLTRDERLDQCLALIKVFLVAPDQVANIITGITVVTRFDLLFY